MSISSCQLRTGGQAGAALRLRRRAFTLIELLTVIAIIGLLAALILWGTSKASQAKISARVRGELAAITLAIDGFHKKHGFFPAGNANAAITGTNQLFYELTGTVVDRNGGTFTDILGRALNSANINDAFGVSGFVNSATNRTEVQDFLPGLKPDAYADLPGSPNVRLLVAPAKGTAGIFNPWYYNSTSPRHNPESYDLWAEVVIADKVVQIGNWKD